MKEGDKVQWLEKKTTKKGVIKFTMRQGKILEIIHGTNASIKQFKSTKVLMLPLVELQSAGTTPNQLTLLRKAMGR